MKVWTRLMTPETLILLIVSLFAGAGFAWLMLCLLAGLERMLNARA